MRARSLVRSLASLLSLSLGSLAAPAAHAQPASQPRPPDPLGDRLTVAAGTQVCIELLERECDETYDCDVETPPKGTVCAVMDLERMRVGDNWFGRLRCAGGVVDITNDDGFRFALVGAAGADAAAYLKAVGAPIDDHYLAIARLHIALDRGPAEAELAAAKAASRAARTALAALAPYPGDDGPRAAALARLDVIDGQLADTYARESALIKKGGDKRAILELSVRRVEADTHSYLAYSAACKAFRAAHPEAQRAAP